MHEVRDRKRSEREGILAPARLPEMNALVAGVLAGCVFATGLMLASTLVGIAAAGWSRGLAISLSTILAGVFGGVLQQIWFNPHVLGLRVSYPARIAAFGITYFVVLAVCARTGRWLPADEPLAWVSFTAAYLAVLAVLTAVFMRLYRRETREFAAHLDAYRRGRARDETRDEDFR